MNVENEFAMTDSPSAHDEDIAPEAEAQPVQEEQPEPAPTPDPEPEAKPSSEAERLTPEQFAQKELLKRLQTATAQRNINREAKEAAEARAAALEALLKAQGVEVPGADASPATPAALTREQITAEAARLVAVQQFNQRCDAVYEDGLKAHGDGFKEAVDNLNAAGVMGDAAFLEALLETEAPSDVIHYLGKDPAQGMRIAELPPLKRAIELDRLARQLKTPVAPPPPPPLSKAPAPITPIGGDRAKDTVDLNDPDTPDDVWFAEMAKRDRARA